MKDILILLVSMSRAKIMPLWIKIRMWTSPTFIKNRFLIKIRTFFAKLLDIRPRDRRDYYPVFRWLVSKRLAFVLVVVLGLGAAIYIGMALPENFLRREAGESVSTYGYRSVPLKFISGTVNILDRRGSLSYSGQVSGGAASGQGVLYGAGGEMVYEGEFAHNRYNGSGTLYYEGGVVEYQGQFRDNCYDGEGNWYRPSGVLEYSGDYVMGVRTGQGTLYNSVGSQVFQGNFLNNEILYYDFLSRPVEEVPQLYSGALTVYQSEEEYCAAMPEINAVYSVKDGGNTLDNQWTVDQVFVLEDTLPLDGNSLTTIRQIMAAMGSPLYYGESWVELPEAVAWNLLAPERPDEMEPVSIDRENTLEDVVTVSGYDRDSRMYLYTFEKDGLLYTFYTLGERSAEFVMYAIRKA